MRPIAPSIEVVIPDVDMTGDAPTLVRDSDSISTFCSHTKVTPSLQTPLRSTYPPSLSTPTTSGASASRTTPSTMKVSINDGSVSKLSYTTSKFMEFEECFIQLTSELRNRSEAQERDQAEQKALLQSIIS
jgi:hypothetical protein